MAKGKRVKAHHSSSGSGTKAKPKKKLKWVPMQIYRVPLNMEQAVLSCCQLSIRGVQTISNVKQCRSNSGCGTGIGNLISS